MPVVLENNPIHEIRDIHFEGKYMLLFVDERPIKVNLENVSPKLLNASDSGRNNYKISPGGYGIHWSEIDEDLSINGLIRQSQKI
jgi:hypothetical protein